MVLQLSALMSLGAEVAEFMKEKGRTLLIKGPPGTGKTTLALTLMEHIEGKSKIYVSTRLPEETLKSLLPWSNQLFIGENRFEDATLITPELLVSQIFGAASNGASIIVLDSWDTFAKRMEPTLRMRTEGSIVNAARSFGARVVFVSEEPTQTTLDYVVDGVIELRTVTLDGRRLREMELVKLRGTRIAIPYRVYTLSGAKFTAFGGFVQPEFKHIDATPSAKVDGGRIIFGSRALDSFFGFGSLRRGDTVGVEYTSEVPPIAFMTSYIPIITSFLRSGRGVLIFPLPTTSPQSLIQMVGAHLDSHTMDEYFRLVCFGEPESRDTSLLNISSLDLQGTFRLIDKELEALRAKSSNGLIMTLWATGSLEALYASRLVEVSELLSRLVSRLSIGGDLPLIAFAEDSPLHPTMISLCRRHIKLAAIHGTLLAYGVKPHTGAYAFQPTDNPFEPRLTEIV